MGYPRIIIAIDGFSSCGKSTLAKDLARELHFLYFDSGAMYRAVCLYLLENHIDFEAHEEVVSSLADMKIEFRKGESENHLFLNNVDVTEAIRDQRISDIVSEVASISEVRSYLVKQQQKLGLEKGVVMDGRDIGTVVFPNAEIKLFLTASLEVRTVRRFNELNSLDHDITKEIVRDNLKKRDLIDSTRLISPLRKTEDAIELDNTLLTHEEQLDLAMRIIDKYMAAL